MQQRRSQTENTLFSSNTLTTVEIFSDESEEECIYYNSNKTDSNDNETVKSD
jgi:hypothetical protein